MDKPMSISERLKRLVGVVDESGFLTIRELAKLFGVSEITVRRDTKLLAENNRIRLVHGGVTSVNHSDISAGSSGIDINYEAKQRIALRAAAMIQPNDILFLDSGTTVQALAQVLPRDFPLTVICCSLDAFESCRNFDNCEIILVGGIFSSNSTLFYGHGSVEMLKKFRTRHAFFGATGCDLKLGVTCRYANDVQLKQAALQTSINSILLVDSDKFGKVGSHFFSEPAGFSAIITDAMPEDEHQVYQEAGCNIIIAEAASAARQICCSTCELPL